MLVFARVDHHVGQTGCWLELRPRLRSPVVRTRRNREIRPGPPHIVMVALGYLVETYGFENRLGLSKFCELIPQSPDRCLSLRGLSGTSSLLHRCCNLCTPWCVGDCDVGRTSWCTSVRSLPFPNDFARTAYLFGTCRSCYLLDRNSSCATTDWYVVNSLSA